VRITSESLFYVIITINYILKYSVFKIAYRFNRYSSFASKINETCKLLILLWVNPSGQLSTTLHLLTPLSPSGMGEEVRQNKRKLWTQDKEMFNK